MERVGKRNAPYAKAGLKDELLVGEGKSAPIALVFVFLHLAPCGRFDVRLVGRRARDVSRAIPAGGLVDLNRDIRARRVARSIVHVAAGHVASTVRHVRRAHCAVAARGVGAFLAVAHEQRAALGVEAAAEGRVPHVVILRDGLDVGDKVEVNFRGRGNWFPGKIKNKNRDGSFDIAYDDGESEFGVVKFNVRAIRRSGSPARVSTRPTVGQRPVVRKSMTLRLPG